MNRSLKIVGLVASGGLVALALALLVNPDPAHAALLDAVFGKDPNTINRNDIIGVLVELIKWALTFASAIAAIFIVVNGYQYVVSAGNPEKIEKAKQGLTWSIGGFILVIGSYAIVLLLAQTLGFTQLSTLQNHQPASLPGSASGILTSIANILFIFAGAVAVVFLILGGYRYVTSQGNQDLVEKAKKTILYAVIGLILVFASASLFDFIATQLKVT